MIIVLFLPLLFQPVTGSVYNVTPDDHYYPNTTCHHCHNLQHYLLNTTKYFTSNTQLLFLPGLHHLHTDLIIQKVHNISLIGSTTNGTTPDTVIQCNSSVGIVMINITNLVLSNITINNCVAVDLKDCSYIQCSHVIVQGQTLSGIYGTNIFGDSYFTHVASMILNITYIDTPVNNIERHFLSIDHYNALDSDFHHITAFEFNQTLYGVNVAFTNSQFILRKHHNAFVVVHFQDSGFGQNIFLIKNCHFIRNKCKSIIVIYINSKYGYDKQRGDIVKIDNSHFLNNAITNRLLYIVDGPNVHIKNCIFQSNGKSDMIHKVVSYATLFRNVSTDMIIENTKFVSNYGNCSLLTLRRAKLQLIGKVLFHNNSYTTNIIELLKSSSISFVNYIQFSKNKVNSIIVYGEDTNFYSILREAVALNFTQNRFKLFASIEHEANVRNCYFQYFSNRQLDKQISKGNFTVLLDNNYEVFPQFAYNNLYITHCIWLSQSAFKTAIPIDVNKQYIQYTNNSGKFPLLPSHQKTLCYCTTKTLFDCSREKFGPYYPGQTIQLAFYIDDPKPEGFKGLKTDVTALNSNNLLPQTACVVANYSEVVQTIVDDKCNQLSYTIAFPTDNHWCELFLKTSHEDIDKVDVYYIEEYPCPVGFTKVNGICQCILALHKVLMKCNINEQTVSRIANSWITATYHSKSYVYHISPYCPFHYCLPHTSDLNFSTPDSQCQFNRSGILCGHCQQGLSTVFGSSHCQQCSNIHLFLIVPIAIAGLVLVLLLFILNLTVTDGTINSFILYANIISISNSLFFPQYTPAYTFISLANLDLGIQTCFYSGMDDYAKMWLQLVFPFYLIFIATSLIITSRYSTKIQRLTARRALPVLATLFLLSYTKILLIVSNVLFSYSSITHIPDKHTTLVWSVDANVPLYGFRFTILFVVCFIILLVQIPFSIILLSSRQLSRFRFISKFKPLLDAYQGPLKDKFYYWSGLQLIIRVVLLSMSSLRSSINVTISSLLLCIIVGLHGYCCPYKKDAKNVSELVFYINLFGLYIFTLYGHDDTMTATNIFITLSGVHFAIILIYHIMTYLCGEVMKSRVQLFMNVMIEWIYKRHKDEELELQIYPSNIPDVTYNYREYREPLVGLH